MKSKSLFASGTVIALAFAAIVGLGIAMVVLYKEHAAGLAPVSVSFHAWNGTTDNVTLYQLDFREVHARDSFLEDHLNTAFDHGASTETDRLRVQQMRDTLTALAAPESMLFVGWEGKIVRVQFTGML